jgi:hypothetical protein
VISLRWRRICLLLAAVGATVGRSGGVSADDRVDFRSQIQPLFKRHCVKCHGAGKHEGDLRLHSAKAVVRGGKSGAALEPGQPDKSRLWQRVDEDEMPPDAPLSDSDKSLLRRWIVAGGIGLPAAPTATNPANAATDHWSFGKLTRPAEPAVREASRIRTPVDRFVQSALEAEQLSLGIEADRRTLIRRVAFDLTGLPPTINELTAFVEDKSPDAYNRMVDLYLASPRYGERWGKYWLDAAGYADSNGYFNADSDRPLAYRYRDYVVRSLNADKPFNQFVREQFAGDEISRFDPKRDATAATAEQIDMLIATHFLRNGQDGSGESDGNPEEVRIDRYTALESTQQIVGSALLGLTIQCAKCHDHKFEPFTHRDYYSLQSVFYPAFNVEQWVKPNDRFVYASLPGEVERWEAHNRELDAQLAAVRREFGDWIRQNRSVAAVKFQDDFEKPGVSLSQNWTNTAPGDDAPGGVVAVNLFTDQVAPGPAAVFKNGTLQIVEGDPTGDKWISTRQAIDWTPDKPGEWVQVTFDLVADKVRSDEPSAARIAFFLSLHDFNDNSSVQRGNILIDGNPAGGAAVHVDYPGADEKHVGQLGKSGYVPGRNYGVRVTNIDGKKFRLEQLIDFIPEEKPLDLTAADLPDGGFGFEFCCGRSFVVDNVVIESSSSAAGEADQAVVKKFVESMQTRRKDYDEATKKIQSQQTPKPGKIAWLTDLSPTPPDVRILVRGNVSTPGEKIEPAAIRALDDADTPFVIDPTPSGVATTGRRLALANWLTRPRSRPAALLARVQVNRVWQQHFGTGLVATSDNLGISGAEPSHPELLEWLAAEFVESGWSLKKLHRLILTSAVYRQVSTSNAAAHKIEPDNRLLWRYPVRRLDAEAIRDAMLFASGELDVTVGGPYVPTTRSAVGEVLVTESAPGANRRSVYLQQRRTQVLSQLGLFDAPTLAINCAQRTVSTMPLQSLTLLNSEFAVNRGKQFASRLDREAGVEATRRITQAFVLTTSREPSADEQASSLRFIDEQAKEFGGADESRQRAWADFCQMLLASNLFLYVE